MPFRGLEGAGEGGRSWPSRSIFEKALVKGLPFEDEEPDPAPDIVKTALNQRCYFGSVYGQWYLGAFAKLNG